MSEKIRVLHVIKTFNLGGAETNLLNLIRAFDPSRVETHVAYSFGGEIEERFRREHLILFKYANRHHKIKSLASVIIVLRLAGYILKNKIDIVHTHNFNAHVWAALAAKSTGKKLIEHVHDFRYIDRRDRERGRFYVNQYEHIRKLKNWSDRVIVLTQQNKEFIIQNQLYKAEKVKLIRNGIPLNESKPIDSELKKSFGIPQDHKIFLTPARMSEEKNIELIFKIAPLVAKEWPNITFLISGNGPMLETYKKRIMEARRDYLIKLIGFCPDTIALLRFAYVMLLPSFLELHPIAILEALSMKVPVMVSENVGSNSEIFRSWENGVVLDPRNAEVWAQSALKLLNDRNLRDKIGMNGFKLCQDQFDIRGTAKQFESLYEELNVE